MIRRSIATTPVVLEGATSWILIRLMAPDNSSGQTSPSRPASSSSETPAQADPGGGDTAHLRAANELAVVSDPVAVSSNVPVIGPLLTLIRRLMRPFVQPFIDPFIVRQEKFNVETVRHLNTREESIAQRLATMRTELDDTLGQELDALRRARDDAEQRQAESLEEKIGVLRGAVEEVDRRAAQRLHFLEVRFVRRSQAIDTRFDESAKILDQVQSRTSNVSEAELRETRAQLSRVLNAARASDPNLATSTENGASTHGAPERLDGALWKQLREWMADEDYRAFQLRFRGDANEISRRMQAHVSRFENVPGPVADLGCGRGEFLELLRDANIEGIGVEINAADVASCVERGLQAECSDLFDWLEARRVETLGGIFIAQVIEHIPPPDWARLTDLAASRLTPGGRLVVETINPESLFALTRAYVLDPTHTRPVHPQLLAFLAQRSGLTDIDIAYQAEVPDACRVSPTNEEPFVGHPPSLAVVRELNLQMWQVNDLLAAPQEYTLSATRISSA